MKKCFKCKEIKPLAEFYMHSAMADGRLGKCKACAKADVRENYAANRDHYLAYEKGRQNLPHRVEGRKEYSLSPAGKRVHEKAARKWRQSNLKKRAAHILVGNAIRDGKLIKKPCEGCGSNRSHAHHDDYSKPLEVRWLCAKHHAEHHKLEKLKNDH